MSVFLVCRGTLYFMCKGGGCKRICRSFSILAALLHDASECYMSDVPRPLKQNMKQYKEQENHLLDVLYTKFLGTPLSEEEEKLIKKLIMHYCGMI